MSQEMLHALLVALIIAFGIYLFAHPLVLKGRHNLIRGVIIWAAIVLALNGLDFVFANQTVLN